jgi:iron complex transport system substrate-binding protein
VRALIAPILFSLSLSLQAHATSRVSDDLGGTIVLDAPARRIVSLAPNLTELLFSAGAGTWIVGAVEYSDYPPPARSIPRIGRSGSINLERIASLKPDLVVAWASGNSPKAISRLREFGFPVYVVQPRHLKDIARTLEHLGELAGTEKIAQAQAEAFSRRFHALAARFADRAPVRVFYQILDPQLITVNGQHLISEILRICGGVNVFDKLPVLAPVVNEEAVLKADPDAIIAAGVDADWNTWLAHWRTRPTLTAVKNNALYRISADLIHRDTLRVLDGADQVCEAIEDVRR